ncbi:hypothetical protein CBR_g17817 [Chara braunii]|uniref:SPX domain-containing protein n=1 Tax=Chara braunii TaxID=69332 RepID=A0A388KVL0_CHABU|nr:hypothetical protein CBR_g17817 [Chara braunii]|eukprot:GBG74106.1 hypothetical protein CBR_g17817 [Chara braunii]
MVHFGRLLREKRLPKWENYYLGYKQMKKRIKMYVQLSPTTSEESRDDMLKEFSEILDYQVEKIVLFLLAREGQLASRLIELREQREGIMSIGRRSWSGGGNSSAAAAGTSSAGDAAAAAAAVAVGSSQRPGTPSPRPGTPSPRPGTPSLRPRTPSLRPGTPSPRPGTPSPRPETPAAAGSTSASAMERPQSADAIRDLVDFHEALEGVPDLVGEYKKVGQHLLELLEFVELNAIALRKILKKFDKQLGYRLMDRYIYTRSNHPYSQLLHVFRHVGIGAMVATISRNLAELRARRLTPMSISLYDDGRQSWPPKLVQNEPIIRAIEEAEERLMQSTGFLKYLAEGSLIPEERVEEALEEVGGALREEIKEDFLTLFLNLLNTFLYMVNYYIVLPTADKYAMQLGADSTLCGVIIGSMALASLVSAVGYSAWSNRSYFSPLVLSTIILVAGNFFYAIALDFDSVWLVLFGRLLCGLGGARAINRRYIADCVARKRRTAASAAFVSASALGMSVGPAVSGVMQMDVKLIGGWTFNFVTAPGWVMCLCWLIYFVVLWVGFKEPHRPGVEQVRGSSTRGGGGGGGGGGEGEEAAAKKNAAGVRSGGKDEVITVVTAAGDGVVDWTALAAKKAGNPPFMKHDHRTFITTSTEKEGTLGAREAGEGAEPGFSFQRRVGWKDTARNDSFGPLQAWRSEGAAVAAAEEPAAVAGGGGNREGGGGVAGNHRSVLENGDQGGGVVIQLDQTRAYGNLPPPPPPPHRLSNGKQQEVLPRPDGDDSHMWKGPELREPLLLKEKAEEEEEEEKEGGLEDEERKEDSLKREMDGGEGAGGGAGSVREADSEDMESEEGAEKDGFFEAMAEMTTPVLVNLLIYFVLKFAVEILLSESSLVTAYYFGWGMEEVALFLSLLGLTVLPINFVVGSYISNVFEDRYILLWAEILTAVGIAMALSLEVIGLQYSVVQYVLSAMVIFVSCQVLEGVNLSLMSKVMSDKLSRGTFNCGLLSTQAGTSARVVSDLLISFLGSQELGMTSLMNSTMLITFILMLLGIQMTIVVFNSLF